MYQESGDEQSKHLWAQRDFPDLPLTDGARLETASPAKVRLAAVLDGGATAQPSAPGTKLPSKTHTLTYKSCPSVACRWKTEAQKFCSEAHLFRLPSSLSTNCFFVTLHWITEQFTMLKTNFEVCAGAVHLPCPRNPTSSLTDVPLNANSNQGPHQPHKQSKGFSWAERAKRDPRIPGTHSSDRKALQATFWLKPSVKVDTSS